ncbi:MAG: hypothetical protein ACYCOU_22755 [Sulfobacillus sp.]
MASRRLISTFKSCRAPLAVTLWHAVQHAYHWTVRFLHYLFPLIPWHTIAWVGGFAGTLFLTVMVARHRIHRRRSAP